MTDRDISIECERGRSIRCNDKYIKIYPWYTYKMLYKVVNVKVLSISHENVLLNIYWEDDDDIDDIDVPMYPEDGDKYLIDDDNNWMGKNVYFEADNIQG